jgi:type IV secretory pathway VirB2 component (pilin)
MEILNKSGSRLVGYIYQAAILLLALLAAQFVLASGCYSRYAVDVLRTVFDGPIARGLSLVAIVVAGLLYGSVEFGGPLSNPQAPTKDVDTKDS